MVRQSSLHKLATEIKAEEDDKAMKFRLRSILFQKLSQTFKSASKRLLKRQINEFVNNKTTISKDDIAEFEQYIGNLYAAASITVTNPSPLQVTFKSLQSSASCPITEVRPY